MLAPAQLPAPSATMVMVSRHDAVALQPGAAMPGEQTMHSVAALGAYAPVGHGVQAARPPVEKLLAPHSIGALLPSAHDAPVGHALHATYSIAAAGVNW